jgi:hypothetical protein
MQVLSRHLPEEIMERHETPVTIKCPGRDSNRAVPEYKSTALTLRQAAGFILILNQMAYILWLQTIMAGPSIDNVLGEGATSSYNRSP